MLTKFINFQIIYSKWRQNFLKKYFIFSNILRKIFQNLNLFDEFLMKLYSFQNNDSWRKSTCTHPSLTRVVQARAQSAEWIVQSKLPWPDLYCCSFTKYKISLSVFLSVVFRFQHSVVSPYSPYSPYPVITLSPLSIDPPSSLTHSAHSLSHPTKVGR